MSVNIKKRDGYSDNGCKYVKYDCQSKCKNVVNNNKYIETIYLITIIIYIMSSCLNNTKNNYKGLIDEIDKKMHL